MDVVADFGNTTVKVGIVENDQLSKVFRFDNEHIDTLKFRNLIQEIKPEKICFLAVTSVSQEIRDIFYSNCKHILHFTHLFALPFQIHYQPLENLGIDRLAGVVGARALFPGSDLLVIQAGTCITYDVYMSGKGYFGGAISPGIGIRKKSLNTFTFQLPLIEEPQSENVEIIGNTTTGSIQSGVYNGALFEMIGFIEFIQDQANQMTVIISGGDMIYFMDKIKKNRIFANPNLTLVGLKEILKLNE